MHYYAERLGQVAEAGTKTNTGRAGGADRRFGCRVSASYQ
jgi:hypothetical protein